MTTIRKIVTSKVDGGSADSTDTNEIRPFGEIAVYLNTEPNPDKLTLMMFDGARTNLKSMVLAPGRLYGSDADSGDGNGRDTIKLIPDASLSDYTGNDQYLIIDPTSGEPGHIHIRAGGTQDASGADLYLGAEQTFVRVSDTNDNVVIRTTALGNIPIENVNVQTVDELVPPGNVWRIFIIASTYPTLGDTVQIGETVTTAWGTPVTATITDIQQDAGQWQIHVDQNIVTGFGGGPQTVTFNRGGKSWTFDYTGALTFPDGYLTIQDSQGGVIVKAADKKSISLISSGDGNIGSAIGWYDNFLVPTKLAAVVANNPLYVGEGDVGIVTGDTPGEGNTTNIWNFGADGNLTLPGNINYANGVNILSGLGSADFSNVSLIRSLGNLTIQTPQNVTATITNENGNPGGPGTSNITGQSLYNPDIALIQPGWIVTGNNLANLTTVTSVVEDPAGTYTITTDTTEVEPFWYNDVYTFTNNVISYSNLVISSGNIIRGNSRINFVANSSGDGNGYSTIEIRPDAELYTDQYIIVDPTGGEPGHIHLRAGGTQDASGADLYLGGELTAVRVSDTSGIVTVRTTNIGDPNIIMDWSFQPDGNLYFPGIGNNRIGESEPGLVLSSDNSVVLQANNSGNINEIKEWYFGTDGSLTLPTGGNIIFDSSATSVIDGVTSINAVGTIGANVIQVLSDLTSFGASPAPRIYGFSSIATTGSAVNEGNISASGNLVASRNAYISGNVIAGNVVSTGNVTASNFIGNISITGNVQGTSPSVQLVAGSYTATFDNTGTLILPAVGGNEGAELQLTQAANSTLSGNTVSIDQYVDQIRIFEGGGTTRGVYIDLTQAAAGVGTLLNNRVSGLVNAGTFVTMDNIKATVTGSAPRGLSLATVSGSFSYNIGGNFALAGGPGGSVLAGQTLTTTPTSSIFGWGFTVSGDLSTYVLTDTTNNRCYRITLQIGASFNNNSIIIERLI